MKRCLVRRFLQLLPVLLAISVLSFSLLVAMPGDPLDMLILGNPNVTAEDIVRLRQAYGLDDPTRYRLCFLRFLDTWVLVRVDGHHRLRWLAPMVATRGDCEHRRWARDHRESRRSAQVSDNASLRASVGIYGCLDPIYEI